MGYWKGIMLTGDIDTLYHSRQKGDKPGGVGPGSLLEDETEEKTSDDDKYILCRHCRQVITHPAERIEMGGSHTHTFANPHGIVYEIGCFRSAPGCGYTGPATDEFSWFKGFYWRIAVCRSCLTHLGWLFTSTGNVQFNGLILDRLIKSE
ncbi:MAG: hypothetical protein JSU83_00370 [Deltaproteobacteria bacterium]|nr:MAG: hypothetical protein JSU83_00370 [Deltaproteobacteria bacterium]